MVNHGGWYNDAIGARLAYWVIGEELLASALPADIIATGRAAATPCVCLLLCADVGFAWAHVRATGMWAAGWSSTGHLTDHGFGFKLSLRATRELQVRLCSAASAATPPTLFSIPKIRPFCLVRCGHSQSWESPANLAKRRSCVRAGGGIRAAQAYASPQHERIDTEVRRSAALTG